MFFKRKPRVLLLDDDPSMHRLVTTILKRNGFRIESFINGLDAVKAIDKENYAVLILDLMMPSEGGMTVIRHLRSNNPEKLKNVLVLSGSPGSILGTIRDVGGIIHKPFETPALIEEVRRIAGKR